MELIVVQFYFTWPVIALGIHFLICTKIWPTDWKIAFEFLELWPKCLPLQRWWYRWAFLCLFIHFAWTFQLAHGTWIEKESKSKRRETANWGENNQNAESLNWKMKILFSVLYKLRSLRHLRFVMQCILVLRLTNNERAKDGQQGKNCRGFPLVSILLYLYKMREWQPWNRILSGSWIYFSLFPMGLEKDTLFYFPWDLKRRDEEREKRGAKNRNWTFTLIFRLWHNFMEGYHRLVK